MYYYNAAIQYDGTNYFGFQWQKDIPSIQKDFNHSLQQLLNGKTTTMGASRTDSGVHATHQIVKITCEYPIDCESFLIKLNNTLPSQIRCLKIVPSDRSFKPNSQSISKEYRYLFTNTLRSGGIDQKYIANNPYRLDMSLMKKCAQQIVGKHDFRNFRSAGSNVKTTVREVFLCQISEIDPHLVLTQSELFSLPPELKKCYQLQIVGSGFLKQMVRHLMSALWLVGAGRLPLDEFLFLLTGPEKTRRLWKVASARGLYLYRIEY